MIRNRLRIFIKGWFLLLILSLANTSYALPFIIFTKPGTQLPTTITPGGTATAFYTVANNTLSQRNNNFVKYLPPNTSQVTTGGQFADTCGSLFNLTAKGQAGSTCTLQLTVTGPVNGNDPDPHHHLFVCFPRGITCAGTHNSLNVTQSGANETIGYVSNFTTNNILICPINANGTFGTCTVTTAIGLSNPVNITLNPAGTFIYAANSGDNTVTFCPVHSDGSLGACISTGQTFAVPGDVAFNAAGTLAYVPNDGDNTVSLCPVNGDGTFGVCAATGTGVAFVAPISVTINANGTRAYIANEDGGFVSLCPINGDGTLGTCINATSSSSLISPHGVALNSANTLAYIADFGSNVVDLCTVNGDGTLSNCNATGDATFTTPNDVVLNSANTHAYVSNFNANTVFICNVTPGSGALTNCTSTGNGFSRPTGIVLH